MELARLVEESIDKLPYKLTWRKIAQKTGMSHSVFSHFKEGSEINFKTLFTIAQMVHPDNYHTVIADWSYYVDAPMNVKFALEYMSVNRMFDHAEDKIQQIHESGTTSKLLIDLANAYTLLLERQQSEATPSDFMKRIKGLRYKTPEGKFLRQMLFAYYYSDVRCFALMDDNLSIAEALLDNVSSEDLRELYSLRIKELKAVSLLFNRNRKEEARKLCEEIAQSEILDNPTYRAGAYFRMATSYMFSSYDMTEVFFKKAVRIYRETGRDSVADGVESNEMEFARVLWKKVSDPSEIKDDSNRAFYYASNGMAEEALEVIALLNQKSPFTKYYEGLAKSDTNLLLESLVLFIKGGDMVYAELPYIELQKSPQLRGVADILIRELTIKGD
ncbi:AimR family lysis-lysogeny pheromone receptor [Rossellomorea sp. GCM10028870]|uniref:AimR family lysis-lysogeny pheromone receptor n=1 Tax=Rossellomorea sp. GCM10028870 TaxID=3273426 RepID=UPI003623AAE3